MSGADTMVEIDEELDPKTGKSKEEFVAVEKKEDLDKTEDVRNKSVEEDDDTVDEDPEREAIRQRRRKEKLERKERREQAMARDKLEMEFLRKQNDALERRLSGVEQQTHNQALGSLDNQIAEHVRTARMAEQVMAKAVSAGNGEDVMQAMRYRDEAVAKVNQLNAIKAQATQPQQSQPQLDSNVALHAQRFLNENKWYDTNGRDEESAIVLAIDNALAGEGYDPRSEDYWVELRKRAARRLPDRFTVETADNEPDEDDAPPVRKPRGGPAVGSGREYAPQSTRREVYISPERKKALVDAGVWDDPVLRQKYVKRYAEYDKQKRG